MNFITFITETVLPFVAASAVLITGLVELAKSMGLNTRFAPALAIAIGVVIGFFFGGYEMASYNILAGVLAGLAASGLYSGVKRTIQG